MAPRKQPNGFNWRLPPHLMWLKEQLREVANENDRTLNQEVTRAVREYLRPRYRV